MRIKNRLGAKIAIDVSQRKSDCDVCRVVVSCNMQLVCQQINQDRREFGHRRHYRVTSPACAASVMLLCYISETTTRRRRFVAFTYLACIIASTTTATHKKSHTHPLTCVHVDVGQHHCGQIAGIEVRVEHIAGTAKVLHVGGLLCNFWLRRRRLRRGRRRRCVAVSVCARTAVRLKTFSNIRLRWRASSERRFIGVRHQFGRVGTKLAQKR